MKISISGQFRSATAEETVSTDFEDESVREALSAFAEEYRAAERRLLDEDAGTDGRRRDVRSEGRDDCGP
ncbi:ubiquitin family protein [Haloarcula amylovorans]|uniref:MoaD/ThiS family protein n=1 Tax=Haloarcula amylovorans TaxID=2562280 RepID=UPI001075DC34|nr:MoaD/ThiS family protein [Halomicroarcula amylolytica]